MVEGNEQVASRLVLELKDLLEEHLKKHSMLTIHGLSKRCGVASSTVRRILSLETKEDPIGSTVLGIVSAIKKETNIEKLLELFPEGSEIRHSLEKSFSFVRRSVRPFSYRADLNDLLSNREAYIIHKMAANASGVRKNDLVMLLGVPVIDMILQLIDVGLIYEEDGVLHAREKNYILPEELSKKHIPELLRFTSGHKESRYVDRSVFRNCSESLNKEAYDKICEIQREANNAIRAILDDKKSMGEIPFFFTCVIDTIEPTMKGEND